MRLLLNGRPPVYTPSLQIGVTNKQGVDESGNLDEPEDTSHSQSSDQLWDSEGEEELSEEDAPILFETMKLALERDEEPEESTVDSDEDSDVDTESEQEDDKYDHDYIPNKIRGSYGRAGRSKTSKLCGNAAAKAMPIRVATGDGKRKIAPKNRSTYEFCPFPHCLPIIRLLSKHFCLHPLLPERHGQSRGSDDIYSDSVHEMYRHCRNNQLREVWAYLWTNWYSPDKWELWARSAYPHAIPRKRTTMVVEAMWRNFKRLVLHLYNRPRVDFAAYALVTQALPLYRYKVTRVFYNPREGRAPALHGEQAPIKKAWEILRQKKLNGSYDTDYFLWTCSCGTQKYHPYLLCKHLVQSVRCPDPAWWATVLRYPTRPFYNVSALLSPADRARAPVPEALGSYSWLTRMVGKQSQSNTPTLSLPVCTIHVQCTHTNWVGYAAAFLTFKTTPHWH